MLACCQVSLRYLHRFRRSWTFELLVKFELVTSVQTLSKGTIQTTTNLSFFVWIAPGQKVRSGIILFSTSSQPLYVWISTKLDSKQVPKVPYKYVISRPWVLFSRPLYLRDRNTKNAEMETRKYRNGDECYIVTWVKILTEVGTWAIIIADDSRNDFNLEAMTSQFVTKSLIQHMPARILKLFFSAGSNLNIFLRGGNATQTLLEIYFLGKMCRFLGLPGTPPPLSRSAHETFLHSFEMMTVAR